jgi:hypothetical protein
MLGAVRFDLQWFGPSTTYVYGLNPAPGSPSGARESAFFSAFPRQGG